MQFEETDGDDDKFLYIQAVESNQICLKLAEEIKTLRNDILGLKDDKRTWMLSKQALESEVLQSRNVLQALKLEIMQLNEENISLRIQLSEKNHSTITSQQMQANNEDIVRKMESKHKCLGDLLIVEKRKSRLLGRELEQSLRDELVVRNHCVRLESDISNMKTVVESKDSAMRNETLLRKQMEICNESHANIVSKINEKLKCVAEKLACRSLFSISTHVSQIDNCAGRGDEVLRLVNIVTAGVSKLLDRYAETRMYMKRLLKAVHQYEDLSSSHVVNWGQRERESDDESADDS